MVGWQSINVASVSLSDLIPSDNTSRPLFIKIDTQGFEPQVFKGAFDALGKHTRWLIKSEFAPKWIQLQGYDSRVFLRQLVDRYDVIEAPERHRYHRDSLRALFSSPLTFAEIDPFVDFVESLRRKEQGWVDLYIAPRGIF